MTTSDWSTDDREQTLSENRQYWRARAREAERRVEAARELCDPEGHWRRSGTVGMVRLSDLEEALR